jgi:biotin carboxylase
VTGQRTLVVGFGRSFLGALDGKLADRSVVVVEDPDVVRKRAVFDLAGDIGCVDEVVVARYHQSAEVVDAASEAHRRRPITAVVPGVEYGVSGAAAKAAACLTDKLLLRSATNAGGILNPPWREVFGPGDVAAFAGGGSVVLKPANRHASLGVQRLDAGDDVGAAWLRTVEAVDDVMLPDRPLAWRYLAERRLAGPEYSVEVLVQSGRVLFRNVTEKIVSGGRYPVELGHVVPAPIDASLASAFADAMDRLVGAIGFDTGVLHAEWIVTADGPALVECAGRAPGDFIVDLVDAAYGNHLGALLVDIASGRTARVAPRAGRAAAVRFGTAPPGTVLAIDGVEAARAMPGVVHADVVVGPGHRVGELTSSWDRLGEVIATGATPAEAAARAAAALDAIRVEVAAEPWR